MIHLINECTMYKDMSLTAGQNYWLLACYLTLQVAIASLCLRIAARTGSETQSLRLLDPTTGY